MLLPTTAIDTVTIHEHLNAMGRHLAEDVAVRRSIGDCGWLHPIVDVPGDAVTFARFAVIAIQVELAQAEGQPRVSNPVGQSDACRAVHNPVGDLPWLHPIGDIAGKTSWFGRFVVILSAIALADGTRLFVWAAWTA